jgi:hypothetical protein
MMSIGHSALGPPTQMVGGAALGSVEVPKSQHKLDALSDKMKMKKEEDLEGRPMPAEDKNLDWETLIGERLNRFSQLLRSEIVRLKLQKIANKIKE